MDRKREAKWAEIHWEKKGGGGGEEGELRGGKRDETKEDILKRECSHLISAHREF